MDDKQYDAMLQEMTFAVRNEYETVTGEILNAEETFALNDLLDSFFADKVQS